MIAIHRVRPVSSSGDETFPASPDPSEGIAKAVAANGADGFCSDTVSSGFRLAARSAFKIPVPEKRLKESSAPDCPQAGALSHLDFCVVIPAQAGIQCLSVDSCRLSATGYASAAVYASAAGWKTLTKPSHTSIDL
jgi:hypothetical protein